MNKEELRKEMLSSLKNASCENDFVIVQKIQELPEYKAADCVFVYVGTGHEIKTDTLIDNMINAGKTVCVPLCFGKGEMSAKQIRSRNELDVGRYGILEPSYGAPDIREEDISLVVVPGVAFGRDFSRLGRGGGYYDRFLEKTKNAVFVAPCRKENLFDTVPCEEHDKAVDVIVTEKKVLRKVR
ncbi:MAG: 5-formyltetrahydrofolate cyclo-ligase [Oscillospiraceae bacterium]|nr:5-formyltetrahydrofolate cyclo-ligase [Oscillospiraceae bacterium]